MDYSSPRSMHAQRMIAGLILVVSCFTPIAGAQSQAALTAKIQSIMGRPEFAHSNFGVEFLDLQTGEVLYSVNADKMFVPASTTKLLTEGTVLAKLGDYRFHTYIYRTGPIDKHGTLKGDLSPRSQWRPKSVEPNSARWDTRLRGPRPLLPGAGFAWRSAHRPSRDGEANCREGHTQSRGERIR